MSPPETLVWWCPECCQIRPDEDFANPCHASHQRIQRRSAEVRRAVFEKGVASASERVGMLLAEVERLQLQLNMPVTDDFLAGVKREAAHQRERWGSDHDAGKTDADWFWLVGYLAGKALHLPEKRLHHCVSAAAALFNWFLYAQGKTNMRPGIAPPAGEPR